MSKASAFVGQFFTRRGLVGLLACAASAGTLCFLGVSQAGAAVAFNEPITFECYNNSVIRADEVNRSLSGDQGNVVWALHLDIWNPRSRQWVNYYNSPLFHFDSDSAFGGLDQNIDVRVAPRHYYLAYDVIATSSTPARAYRDHAEIGATSEFACWVP